MKKKLSIMIIIGILGCVLILILINKEEIEQNIQHNSQTTKDTTTIEEDGEIATTTIVPEVKEVLKDASKAITNNLFKKGTNVFAIGDSLTEGIGDNSGNGGYIGILDQTINEVEQTANFTNFGKQGHRTDQLLKRLDEPEVIEEITDADVILITIGANDIMKVARENFTKLTIELFTDERINFEARLEKIIAQITTINPTAKVYLLGIYNPFKQYFEDIEELDVIVNEWNRTGEIITDRFPKASFIPIKDIFDLATEHLFAEDNFHPNSLGYERMADRVLQFLLEEEGARNN